MSGRFITFEGIDGSGKSTQLAMAVDALRALGKPVLQTRNPGGTAFGQALRDILLHGGHAMPPVSETLLFLADRAEHWQHVVSPALKEGWWVLCDRYADSTLAYQGYGRGLAVTKIADINAWVTEGHSPDLTLLFDAPPEALQARLDARGAADRMEGLGVDFYNRVRQGFLALAAAEPARIRVLDALQPVDALHAQVMGILT
ncbi:MAG: dTMP kinase [Candidatus Melainabacteria bacterium]